MKIGSTSSVETAGSRRTQRRSDKAASSFHLDAPGGARPAAALSPASPLPAVDALLTLQAVPEVLEGKRRALRRAGDMLDILDDIRLSLLEGRIPRGKLEGLLRTVQSRRDAVADPALSTLLDEIEIRAEVELAKFEASSAGR
jgi:Class II flagellar assembly regulator